MATMTSNAQGTSSQNAQKTKEYYQLRRYSLRNGAELSTTQDYFANALIPALNRMGMAKVGTFQLAVGPDTPSYFVLVSSQSAETLLTLDHHLGEDKEFLSKADAFWNATATAPSFQRVSVRMLSAFAGFPSLVTPKPGKRMFQLRTYESPSMAAHAKKVEMFESAEIAIFQRTGLTPVFFAHDLTGDHLPSLTYMLTFADVAELTAHWATFVNDPEWKTLSHKPGYTDPEIVSNITNLYLNPLPSSQI